MSDWTPSASVDVLRVRADIIRKIRHFFNQRGFLEVETPLLSASGTPDLNLDSVSAGDRYLQTSPEYPMKRLLAAGSGPIFQICKVFRENESGSCHNPEFTMLEWYQPGINDEQLWKQACELITDIAGCYPVSQISYRDAFQAATALDPLTASLTQLQQYCSREFSAGAELDRDECLNLMTALAVEKKFPSREITVMTDFPASQAALAKCRETDDGQMTAHRFEIFCQGLELANGYWELTDATEQEARFREENRLRQEKGKAEIPLDEHLISALKSGMPDCAGIALGVDRLIMLATGQKNIRDVISFSWEKA